MAAEIARKLLLVVEDNPGDVRLLREMFIDHGAHGTELIHVERLGEAEKYLADNVVEVILLDLGLPDGSGVDVVRRIRAVAPRIPLVVLTGLDDESLAAQALHEGAQDYLIKGEINSHALLRSVRYAIERKNMEEALWAEQERAQVALNCIGDAVACTDSSGNITFLNIVAQTMTGWRLHEALGQPMDNIFRLLNAATREVIQNPMVRATGQNQTVHLPANSVLMRRDGLEIPIEDSASPMHTRAGKATGAVIVFRDVSAARALALQVAHSAEHDFLTGLPNRVLLNDRINQAISAAPRNSQHIAVIFLDLDRFKYINDSLGHSTGDKLLQSIAKCLKACVRSGDTVSRQGGDEFVVLLTGLSQPEDSVIMSKRILEAIAQPHCIDQRDLRVSTSIGVSLYPHDGTDAETLIKNADTAMYQAKERGSHTCVFFMASMNARAVARQAIEESLRCAIDRQEFALHYQPKVNLITGKITGVEALLRWTHPTRGSVPPSQFISVAEDCGMIVPLGNWCLREACRQGQEWVNAGLPPITMAVNISAIEFRSDTFLAGILSILEETHFDPKCLELELTESVLMKHGRSSEFILNTLRERGVQIAVDDFGTGYSSLSYLKRFPLDALKIDRSFVHQITGQPIETTIVTAVINMGRSLNLRVIAEGVETQEELAFLQAHQCEEAQGYYFSRAIPAGEFAKLLRGGIPKGRFSPLSQQRVFQSGNGVGKMHGTN
jgi:diguanylate cyclase (GGDEF)-like protein/PAS domain S-box-containing protein